MKKKITIVIITTLCLILLISCSNDTYEHKHNFGDWQIEQEATCTADGLQKRTCICGKEESKIIQPYHKYTNENYCESCYQMKPGSYTEGLVYEEYKFWLIDAYTVSDIGTATNEKEIIVPAYHNGKKVRKIDAYAFQNCTNIESIVLSSMIEVIDLGAFSGCSTLNSITIPPTGDGNPSWTDQIGSAFGSEYYYGSEAITQITEGFDDDFEKVEYSKTWYIPKTLKTIKLIGSHYSNLRWEPYAFYGLNIENVIITASVDSFGSDMFNNCKKLKNVVFQGETTLTQIGGFANCESLENITIPEGIETIGYGCFDGCINLKNINLPNSLTHISPCAFRNCTSLENIILPNNLKYIENWVGGKDDGAFYNCTSLKEITLPSTLKEIDEYTFYNCINLKTIYNYSRLNIIKGSTNNGYVGYYASNIIKK